MGAKDLEKLKHTPCHTLPISVKSMGQVWQQSQWGLGKVWLCRKFHSPAAVWAIGMAGSTSHTHTVVGYGQCMA